MQRKEIMVIAILISALLVLVWLAGVLQWSINRNQVKINKALQEQINRRQKL